MDERIFARRRRITEQRCPPHWFDASWVGGGEDAPGCIYCKLCGEIRRLEFAVIEAPAEERIGHDR